jgi:hypothetical protein
MDCQEAISAHQRYKIRLRAAISAGTPSEAEIAKTGSDCECDLGAWLKGEGFKKFGAEPEFPHLTQVHGAFHKTAALVLKAARAGNPEEAQRLLAQDFFVKANEITKALLACSACHGHTAGK